MQITQRVEWEHGGRQFQGQVAEINFDGATGEGVAIVDGSDKNRWHFDLLSGEIVRRFPIPLPPAI